MLKLINKRLVYIMSNFPCYSETFILSKLVELRKRGHKLFIFSLKKTKEKLMQEQARDFLKDTFYSPFLFSFELWKAQVYFLVNRPNIYLRLLFDILRHCIKRPLVLLKNLCIFPKSVYFAFYISSKGINHLHAHFANYPATSAMIISKLLNIPFSFTCHAHDIFYDATMLDLKVKSSKACFTISNYNRKYISSLYLDLPKGKIKILNYGIDLERFPLQKGGIIHDKLRILSVARLMPTKGFDDLIRSCRILKDKGVSFICKIIGEGPMEGKLKKLIRHLNLEDEVVLAGSLAQGEIIIAHRDTDVFVLVSKRSRHRDVQDGMPLVLIEAMATGISVISTRLSGIPELIEDGVSGFLVEPKDYRALAERILLLNSNVELREKFALNAHNKIVAEFDIKKSMDKLLRDIFGE